MSKPNVIITEYFVVPSMGIFGITGDGKLMDMCTEHYDAEKIKRLCRNFAMAGVIIPSLCRDEIKSVDVIVVYYTLTEDVKIIPIPEKYKESVAFHVLNTL